jgi:hypothetical protein
MKIKIFKYYLVKITFVTMIGIFVSSCKRLVANRVTPPFLILISNFVDFLDFLLASLFILSLKSNRTVLFYALRQV